MRSSLITNEELFTYVFKLLGLTKETICLLSNENVSVLDHTTPSDNPHYIMRCCLERFMRYFAFKFSVLSLHHPWIHVQNVTEFLSLLFSSLKFINSISFIRYFCSINNKKDWGAEVRLEELPIAGNNRENLRAESEVCCDRDQLVCLFFVNGKYWSALKVNMDVVYNS